MKWMAGMLGSDGKPETFKSAQPAFFKSKIPNFDAPKGFDRALTLWRSQREKYLANQECLTCEGVTIAQLTKNNNKRQLLLESNAGPYPKRQETTRDEHEIYPADPDATVAHDSSTMARGAGQPEERRGRQRP